MTDQINADMVLPATSARDGSDTPAQLVHRLIDARAPQAGQPHVHLHAPLRIQGKELLDSRAK